MSIQLMWHRGSALVAVDICTQSKGKGNTSHPPSRSLLRGGWPRLDHIKEESLVSRESMEATSKIATDLLLLRQLKRRYRDHSYRDDLA